MNQKGKGLIKITKCSGSWKPSSKSIYMTEREMVLHGGRGQHMKKKPKKDSFSYNTDWKAADLVHNRYFRNSNDYGSSSKSIRYDSKNNSTNGNEGR